VIGTECIGRSKSYYRMIAVTVDTQERVNAFPIFFHWIFI